MSAITGCSPSCAYESLQGIIDLNGPLPIEPSFEGAPRRVTVDGLGGLLLVVPYEAEYGGRWADHYCDAAFLRSFMRHPTFRMIK